ncbi:MAG: hypothetical protein ABL982_14980 [Vicinamibacterales bacterium]
MTDLGTYQLTVAADSAKDAQSIAKAAVTDEATTLPGGMRIIKRELEASADIALEQPIRKFRVAGTYSVDFFLTVPAATKDESERHAKRLYDSEPFPWEHETSDDRVHWQQAREVVS